MTEEGIGANPVWKDLGLRRMLLADWLATLAADAGLELDQHGRSGDAYTLGPSNGFHVRAEFIEEEPYLRFIPSDGTHDELIQRLVREASARVQRFEFGEKYWYSTELHEQTFDLSPSFMGGFMERLGNQTRIAGWRRLGGGVLLDFTEEVPEGEAGKAALFAPKAIVNTHLALPGPRAGLFTSHLAHSLLEVVSAISSFALGRPVNLPHTIFPTKNEQVAALEERRTDSTILTLARKGVTLDIMGWATHPGGHQVFERLRSALLTCNAAVRQEHDAVASILYVASAECLTPPQTLWKKEKLTKRFREFFDELMPEALEKIVAHGNFEEAFRLRRGEKTPRALRRKTLERIYAFRSGQLHEGLDPVYRGFLSDSGADMRRALLSDFAEEAILHFIKSPRSSLIGHPGFESASD